MGRQKFLNITSEVIDSAFRCTKDTRRETMEKLLTLLLLFMTLGISGCLSMYDNEGWGYMGGSESYQEGHGSRNSEHDD